MNHVNRIQPTTWRPQLGALVQYKDQAYTLTVIMFDEQGQMVGSITPVYRKGMKVQSIPVPLTELCPIEVPYANTQG